MREYEHYVDQQKLQKAIEYAEKSAAALRDLAFYEMKLEGDGLYVGVWKETLETPPSISVDEAGMLIIILPAILPKRGDLEQSYYLSRMLEMTIRNHYAGKHRNGWPKFSECVLVYEHIYNSEKRRRFIDHDNMEIKHIQDTLEWAFLTNDSPTYCSAFQCSHEGESNCTRIWILTPEQFMIWLASHWRGQKKQGILGNHVQVSGAKNNTYFCSKTDT